MRNYTGSTSNLYARARKPRPNKTTHPHDKGE